MFKEYLKYIVQLSTITYQVQDLQGLQLTIFTWFSSWKYLYSLAKSKNEAYLTKTQGARHVCAHMSACTHTHTGSLTNQEVNSRRNCIRYSLLG